MQRSLITFGIGGHAVDVLGLVESRSGSRQAARVNVRGNSARILRIGA